ncbi:MAG: hypothetical protein QOH96_1542 [Blastocatellia bacterium]|nr:hypothetical protein [Blastocatellia bacterium]
MHFRGDMRECKSTINELPGVGARVEVKNVGVFTFEKGTEFTGAGGNCLQYRSLEQPEAEKAKQNSYAAGKATRDQLARLDTHMKG